MPAPSSGRWPSGRRRALLTPLLAVLLSLAIVGSASADTAVPDPTLPGSLTVNKLEYYGGSVMMSAPNIAGTSTAAFQQPLDGALFYPTGSGPYPVIVLLHGNHSDCLTTTTGAESSPQPCAPPNVPILNYEGYDYMASNLASHGYVVLSLDADALTSYQTSQDNGTLLRTQLISASLDMVYNWEDGAPLYQQTSPGVVQSSPTLAPNPYVLAGKINLAQGVGVWGHSRGAEGAAAFVAYNRNRPAPGKKYKIDADMAFAPVDYERLAVYGTKTTDVASATNNSAPGFTAFSAVLPMCDGDVSNIAGARIFMNSLFAESGDPSPKIQFAFQGGDHDYTNTIWASSGSEDGAGYSATNTSGTTRSDAACGEDQPNNIRLTPTEQQNYSLGITAAFMRRYVGGETAFDPLMTGAAPMPAGMCPTARGVTCDQEQKTTYFSGADQRTDLVDPDPNTGLNVDALGGSLSGSGFENPYQAQYCVQGTCEAAGTPVPATTPQGYDWCDPEAIEFKSSGNPSITTAAKPCPLPPTGTGGVFDPVAFGGQANEREGSPVNRSSGPQLSLAWNGPAHLDAEVPASDGDVSARKVLAFDVGVDYFDSRNPASGPNNPVAETDPTAAMQDFDVQLTDAAGHSASVEADDPAFGTALEPSLGTSRRHVLLNEVRIPLDRFAGVDLTHVAKVSLVFGGRTHSGAIQMADMRFQESQTIKAADPVVGGNTGSSPSAPVATREATVSTTKPTATNQDAIAIDGTNTAPKKASACADTSAPHTALATVKLKAGRLVVTGTARDAGCAATSTKKATKGAVRRVQVSLATSAKGGACRFVTIGGHLTPAHPCTALYALVAHGTTSFSLKLPKVKDGTYRLRIQGIDAAGNLEAAHGHTVRVVHGNAKVGR